MYHIDKKIDNPYVLIHFYGLPLAFFTTFFLMSNNQTIAMVGKESQFEKFFYLTNTWKSFIEVFIPLIIGIIMYYTSYETSLYIMLVTSLISLWISFKLEKTNVNFKQNKIKDIFKRETDPKFKKLNIFHYVYIFLAAMVIQYLDVSINGFQYTITENPMYLGLLKTFFVILIFITYIVKKKEVWSEEVWFNISIGLLIVSFLLSVTLMNLISGPIIPIIILTLFSLSIFIIMSSSLALSFRLLNTKDDFGKFATLFKREIIRNVGKILITFAGFYLSFKDIYSKNYEYLGYIIIFVSLILIFLYKTLNKKEIK